MIIALVGLPSAGKSSIINSLIGKRVAQTGICRTTLDSKLYNNLISDDNINYEIYDLPGIADIEDKDKKFDTNIKEIIKKCDLVIWVSDIQKSFITNHEYIEFNNIKKYIDSLKLNNGLVIQLIILLSKTDIYINFDNPKSIILDQTIIKKENKGEILDDTEEDTTLIDMYLKILNKFKDKNIDLICFNAHGRSYWNKDSYDSLKKFIKPYNPSNNNTSFYLKKYYDYIPIHYNNVTLNYIINSNFNLDIIKDDYKKALLFDKTVYSNDYKTVYSNDSICNKKCFNHNDSDVYIYCGNNSNKNIKCAENCINCITDRARFRCIKHNEYLCNENNDSNRDKYTVNSIYINNKLLIKCLSKENPCMIDIKKLKLCSHNTEKINIFNNTDKNILHQENINNKDIIDKFKLLGDIINEFYNKCNKETKQKIFNFLLYTDNKDLDNDTYLLIVKKENYKSTIWNLLCKFIKIDVLDIINPDLLQYNSSFKIYRLIQIGKDLSIYQKLYLYNLSTCNTIKLSDNTYFIKHNIYNIDIVLNEYIFHLHESEDIFNNYDKNSINYKYTLEIYNTDLLTQIKNIRIKTYSLDSENNINISMIPIAYKEFGLFWKPI